jgi:hypothetical protein
LFQHLVIMIMTTKGPTEKNDALAWERHHRVLQRMLFWHWFSLMGTFLPFEIITYAI